MNVADLLHLPWLEADLDRLEMVLHGAVAADDPFLAEVAGHLLAGGGKRLRPALTLVAAATGGVASTDEVLLGGVSVELVHLASLYHDDVMDEATSRRHLESVNAKWGNLMAVVAGDFLLARAAGIAASLGTEVAGLLAATLARMMEGQVREVQATFDLARSEAAYLAAIAGKTASLMAAACRIGALTARLDRPAVEAVTAFGESLGMVFQIRDDILDVIGTDDELGKPPGQDLVEGVYTLPVLRAMADPEVGPGLVTLLGRPLDPSQRDVAREVVTASGAITMAAGEARVWADRAAEAVGGLGPGPLSEALRALPYALLDTVPLAAV